MLDFVRKHSRSWMVKVVLWLIIVVFVAWGGYSYTARHQFEMAQVGGITITDSEFNTAYSNAVENYRRQLGPAFSEELIRKLDVKKQTLENLIINALVLQAAQNMGLAASPDEVRQTIVQQFGGRFDPGSYEMFLRQNRMSPEMFESKIAHQITIRKIGSIILDRAVLSEDEILTDYHFNRDKISLAYVPVDPKPLEDQVKVDDASIRSFYDGNQNKYMEPEKREVSYVIIDAEELGKDIPVSDSEVKSYYDEHPDKYKHEKEVHARHILISLKPSGATEQDIEASRAEAQKILEEAKKGKDFAELAKKYSQDPGSAKQGGDLGWFDAKKMVPEFSEAAFSLQKGQISDVVKTSYGFHIIKVEDVREARTTPFEEVKGEIAKQLRTEAVQDIAYKKARDLRDMAFARKDIVKAAQEMKLGNTGTKWIDASENQPDAWPFNPQIKNKLFELHQGEISETFELPGRFMVAQVKTIKAPAPIPFEQVKDKVDKDYRAEQAKTLAQKKAADILKTAVEKKSLTDAAKQFNLTVRHSEPFSRQEPDKDLMLLRGESLNEVFNLDESKPFTNAPLELGSRFIVCQLVGHTAAGAPTPEERAEIYKRLLQEKQATVWLAWVNELKKNTKIEKFKDV